MIVREIYDDVRSITNFTELDLNLSRITDAVEVLNNKGEFDALVGYLDIPITNSNIVTLPSEVQTPLKVNIDGNPSFSRDRLYEFTLNGPGSETERVDFSWEDRGAVPVMFQPPITSSVTSLRPYTVSSVEDDGKKLTLLGLDSNGNEISDEIILNSAAPNFVPGVYASFAHVKKDITVGPVFLRTLPNGPVPDSPISKFSPLETEPEYRQIRLSKTGVTAHILFKRKNLKVTSLDDFIPIRSKMGLIYMIKALEAYRWGNTDLGDAQEKLSIRLATEEQKSHNAFIELSANSESPTIRGLNYNNSDSIIVADIFDEVAKIKGPIGTPCIFDVITEAHEALANKSQWDGLVGAVDIMTDQYHFVTLPRYVEVPISLNICGMPTIMKNKWFEYHLNGPGTRGTCGGCTSSWVDEGDVVTFRDVSYSQQLVAIPDLDTDADTEVRAYGYFQGKRIWTDRGDGTLTDGFIVPCNRSGTTSTQFVDRIERITKDRSNGFIKLLGFDSSKNLQVTIGYYWPDETEPNYRRIKVQQPSLWVRMAYRRRTRKITSLTDPLHLKSKLAILTMIRSIDLLNQGKVAEADLLEKKAVQYLAEEQMSRNPSESFSFQVGPTDGADRIGNIV